MGRFSPTVLPDYTNPFATALAQGASAFVQARAQGQAQRADRQKADDDHQRLAAALEQAAYERSQRPHQEALQKAQEVNAGIEDDAPVAVPLGSAISPFGMTLNVPKAQAFPGKYQAIGNGQVLNLDNTQLGRETRTLDRMDAQQQAAAQYHADEVARQQANDAARVAAERYGADQQYRGRIDAARITGASRETVAKTRGIGSGRTANLGTALKAAEGYAADLVSAYGSSDDALAHMTDDEKSAAATFQVTPAMLKAAERRAAGVTDAAALKLGAGLAQSYAVPTLGAGIDSVRAQQARMRGAGPAPLGPRVNVGDIRLAPPPAPPEPAVPLPAHLRTAPVTVSPLRGAPAPVSAFDPATQAKIAADPRFAAWLRAKGHLR